MIASLEVSAALLVCAAGLAKITSPASAAVMLRRAVPVLGGVRPLNVAVRVAGAAEVAVGAAVIVFGGRVAAAVLAGCYLIFAAVAARLARTATPCGCFGRAASPIGPTHVIVTLAGATVGLAAVVRPTGPVGDLFSPGAFTGALRVGQVVLLAYLAFLALTALPALAADRRRLLGNRS